jgi:hypothetical protein
MKKFHHNAGVCKVRIDNEQDWRDLNTPDKNDCGWFSWHGQEDPTQYPCLALGVFSDFHDSYIYGFAYLEDFEVIV